MANEPVLNLRLIVEHPPAGVFLAVQIGKVDLLQPVARGGDLSFELSLRIKSGPRGRIVLLGPAAQGPPDDRFLYVNSGTMAGQPDSCWSRRAKVKLAGIDATLVERALAQPGGRIEGRIAGTGRNGGPVCATVPLVGTGWQIARA